LIYQIFIKDNFVLILIEAIKKEEEKWIKKKKKTKIKEEEML
jgi:hypothetical protein